MTVTPRSGSSVETGACGEAGGPSCPEEVVQGWWTQASQFPRPGPKLLGAEAGTGVVHRCDAQVLCTGRAQCTCRPTLHIPFSGCRLESPWTFSPREHAAPNVKAQKVNMLPEHGETGTQPHSPVNLPASLKNSLEPEP
jgi:hypothetical protein